MKTKQMTSRLASLGRGKDTLLAHINPEEASLLKTLGGSGVTNPNTGILEFDDGMGLDGYSTPTPGTFNPGSSFADGFKGDVVSFGDPAQASADPFAGADPSAGNTNMSGANTDFAGTSLMDQALADNAVGDNNMYRNPDFQQKEVDYDAMDWLQGNWNRYGKYLKFGLGMLGRVNPAIGTAMSLYNIFSNPRNGAAGAAGGTLAGALAGAVNPALAGVGSVVGSQAAQEAAKSLEGSYGMDVCPKGGSSTTQMGAGDAGTGLGMIWNRYQTAKDYGNQASNLASLYGQNSPYSQQLQQSLLRKDAAAGRRSQYGTRNVELQARLADLASRDATKLQGLTQAKGDERAKMLLNMATLGKGLYDL